MTYIINLLSGPSTGKSTIAAALFSQMKMSNINCELAHEFAKDLTWEGRNKAIKCQSYIFGKQLFKLERLLGEVSYIITDSPIILSPIYDQTDNRLFKNFVVDYFKKMNNINIFLERNLNRPYNPKGRNQTEEESKQIDNKIRKFLIDHDIRFRPIKVQNNMDNTVDEILHYCVSELTSIS